MMPAPGAIPPRQRRWMLAVVAILLIGAGVVAFSSRPRPLKAVAVLSSLFSAAAIVLALRQDRERD